MQEPERVMVGVAENIQACLRIFRRAQHQGLARDILHLPQGVFMVYVLHPVSASQSVLSVVEKKNLSSGVLPSRQHLWYAIYTEGVAPGYSW